MAKSYKYKRSRKALSLDDAKLRMTDSIKAIEKIVLSSDDDEKQIRAAYAMAGLIGKYQKLIETTDLVNRIEKLENNYESYIKNK